MKQAYSTRLDWFINLTAPPLVVTVGVVAISLFWTGLLNVFFVALFLVRQIHDLPFSGQADIRLWLAARGISDSQVIIVEFLWLFLMNFVAVNAALTMYWVTQIDRYVKRAFESSDATSVIRGRLEGQYGWLDVVEGHCRSTVRSDARKAPCNLNGGLGLLSQLTRGIANESLKSLAQWIAFYIGVFVAGIALSPLLIMIVCFVAPIVALAHREWRPLVISAVAWTILVALLVLPSFAGPVLFVVLVAAPMIMVLGMLVVFCDQFAFHKLPEYEDVHSQVLRILQSYPARRFGN